MPVEEYLNTSFPDGDCEFVDGTLVKRNVGAPGHSLLQKILIFHLSAFESPLRVRVLPECRTRVSETRYRVPDIAVMVRPFRQNDRVVLDAPFLVVEILSPEDSLKRVLQRFADYQAFGVPHLVLLDPEDRTAYSFLDGDLVQREFSGFEIPGRGTLPFRTPDLFEQLLRESSEE